ncbi:hypothetical protein [Herpetosiphon geysericola]|uniref:Lipoprotein n=1 Tax=Herpetosiphon geysericola TaxID=70996 RepID=A0A0P6YAK8_9CHLR|nr:hypothetical protein [Herpetosiphon geysericola]KPL87049.1 hypothetical protein SE18_11200 [Herpetosiphon geysericola]
MRSLQRTINLSVGLLLILAACGRTSNQPAASPVQRGQVVVVHTATAIVPSPTVAKKFVFDTQLAISIATELALSPTSQPPILTFPPSPTSPPVQSEKITGDCEPWRNFIPSNCWFSDRRKIIVQAGSSFDRQQGRIQVLYAGRANYDTPERFGSIKIYAVDYPIVDLYTNTTHLLFNLETRQWLDVDGTPLPTATP